MPGDVSTSDTIYALSSGRPPAAVAIIRTSGPRAHDAARLLTRLPPPRQAALRTLREPSDGRVIDAALVLRFDAPESATGENVVEYQCHGGRAVVDALLAALGAIDGLREAQPGEFTRRAFANGRIDLTEAEGLADLLEAETEAQRRAALALASGGLKRQIEQWQSRLVELSARAEAAIDYVDEDDVAGGDARLDEDARALADELAKWLARPRIEPLRDGVRVVVAGPTNAGKSSLVNAIAESERAIVTEIPGTTRDTIEVPLAIGGIPFLLVDTAGLRDTEDRVERIGIGRARGEFARADILLWLGEPDAVPDHPRLILVHSKSDQIDRAQSPSRAIAVSALTRAGIDALVARIVEQSRTLLPGEDALALNRRQAAALASVEADLREASATSDIVLAADHFRSACNGLDRLTGRAGVEDMLDALFGRFCLGK
ncbi:MAG TPA: tRNA uridine-5-carboxymethylaminomethyl(34) synthesis GTPase MnmE [Sphingomicrobium sp.]|nr:tRNA uridine-5-carboxymethylaminomethyl(34) synthesis GTPase MnmE [Sphingomicrobium sp.]